MSEWMWPGLRGRVARIEARAARRVEQRRALRPRHRLPTVGAGGSLAGRAILVPALVGLVFVVVVAAVVGILSAVVDLSGAPVGGLSGVFAFFVADQWYVRGARRLGLLPSADPDRPTARARDR